MQDKDLILFTYNFPFGTGETFLDTELNVLSGHFRSIHIFPLSFGEATQSRAVPSGVTFSTPLIRFDIKRDKWKLLFAGIFCISPVGFAIIEFFRGKMYSGKAKLVNWLGSTLILRILLSNSVRSRILRETGTNTKLYFYWGDKMSGIVPFIRKEVKNTVIIRFHGSDLYEELKGGIPYRLSVLKNLDYAVLISHKGKSYLENKYNNIKLDTRIFRLGVNGAEEAPASSDSIFRILSCSNMVPVKRIHLLYESVILLPFPVIWTHIGSGPEYGEISKMAKAAPSHVSIVLKGQMQNRDVLAWYKENPVDLFVNVSESEGIPVAIMEAISYGIPVIATDVGGTSEIVNSNNGYLLPANPGPELIARSIHDFHCLGEHQKLAMRTAAKHHWNTNFNAEKNYNEFAVFLKSL
jgi:colanic acid/amylovoran biosynthesis glycosyltransferase